MDQPLQTIEDVLAELSRIIDHAVDRNDPGAVFAFVYRRTTEKILEGLNEGRFTNREKLERFDVAFAKRYIDAYWQYQEGEEPTRSWREAFDAARHPITLLQHAMLGMNAHINLDLGIVAAQAAPGDRIHDIKADFMLVNQLLEELIDEMQERLSRASRLLFLLDWVGGRKDESIVNFSIRRARDFAWLTASNLAYLDGDAFQQYVHQTDDAIAAIARRVAAPRSRLLKTTLRVIQYFEEKDVGKVIALLR